MVEDDLDLNEVMCDFLESMNATVLSAPDGQKALAILDSENVNFILSDIQMPIMDGFALLNHIQKNSAQKPPLLFVTGEANVTELDVKSLGAVGLIKKPFNKDTLKHTLSKFLVEDRKDKSN